VEQEVDWESGLVEVMRGGARQGEGKGREEVVRVEEAWRLAESDQSSTAWHKLRLWDWVAMERYIHMLSTQQLWSDQKESAGSRCIFHPKRMFAAYC
jgi:hypothetical protein